MAAVSWSNVDYFTRNIGTIISGSVTSTATVAELLEHMCATNGPAVWTWPTADQVREFARLDGHPEVSGADTVDVYALEIATAAATARIARAKGLTVRPVDTDGAVDNSAEPVTIDPDIHLAALLLAARFYDRRDTPEGPDKSGRPWGHFVEIDPDIAFLLEEPPSL